MVCMSGPLERGKTQPKDHELRVALQVLDAKISVMQKLDILVCCFGLRKVRAHGLQEAAHKMLLWP